MVNDRYDSLRPPQGTAERLNGPEVVRGRKFNLGGSCRRGPGKTRSLSVDERTVSADKDCSDGVLPSGVAPVDSFIISRLNDSSSYFFTWFCKRYRIRIGVRDLGGKEGIQRCPICLDPCTKSIELQCGHAFCRSCLTISAANNMTSCALCRREQVINPELLRARFDEQRMLNLAQRLAIPPPTRSRPVAAHMPAAGMGGRKEGNTVALSSPHDESGEKGGHDKDYLRVGGSRPLAVESMTARGHLLFGPWGDVGAMSTEDLRRRWNFSSVQTSTAPSAATIGAASAADLRSSWRELQNMSHASARVSNEHDRVEMHRQTPHGFRFLRDAKSSCEVGTNWGDTHSSGASFELATPDSPCAGGSPLRDLSSRWRALARVPVSAGSSQKKSAGHDVARTRQSNSMLDAHVAHAEDSRQRKLPGETSTMDFGRRVKTRSEVEKPQFDEDIGDATSDFLRQRWNDVLGEGHVGSTEVKELAIRLARAKGAQGVGALPIASLKKCWSPPCSRATGLSPDMHLSTLTDHEERSVGGDDVGSDVAGTFKMSENVSSGSFLVAKTSAASEEAVGAASNVVLYRRWCAANGAAAPVG